MHSDSTSFQLRAELRASLPDMMAAYERTKGPVKTLPIMRRDEIIIYNGRIADAEHAAARARGSAVQRKRPVSDDQLPLKQRRTRKAREAAALREVWP